MIISKLHALVLAAAGCAVAASAYVRWLRVQRVEETRRNADDLRTWEAEGGSLASPAPAPARPPAAPRLP